MRRDCRVHGGSGIASPAPEPRGVWVWVAQVGAAGPDLPMAVAVSTPPTVGTGGWHSAARRLKGRCYASRRCALAPMPCCTCSASSCRLMQCSSFAH